MAKRECPILIRARKKNRVLSSINKHGFLFDPHWIEILCEIGLVVYKIRGYPVLIPKVNGRGRKVRVHRMITLCPDGLYVDHINRVREDNRGRNLRVVHPSDNRLNLSAYKTYKYTD